MKSEKQKIKKVYMLYHRDKKNDDIDRLFFNKGKGIGNC